MCIGLHKNTVSSAFDIGTGAVQYVADHLDFLKGACYKYPYSNYYMEINMPRKFVIRDTTFRIHKGSVNVRYWIPGVGRPERVLKDMDGNRIKPRDGAYINDKGKYVGATPDETYDVYEAAIRMCSRLEDEGTFSALGNMTFKQGMKTYLEYRVGKRNNPEFEKHSQASIDTFGHIHMGRINHPMVQDWVEEYLVEKMKYSYNTIRNKVACPKAMYNHMIKRGEFKGDNPFIGHEWKAKKEEQYIKSKISPAEYQLIQNLCTVSPDEKNKRLRNQKGLPMLKQASTLIYYTGQRPDEIYRIRPEHFNHKSLMLTIKVTKTGTYDKIIAIPKALSTWVLNWDWVEMNEKTIQNRIATIRKKDERLDGLTMRSFRRNYASIMEKAECPHEFFDAHQGRYQSSVAKKHYLRDKRRAYELMMPYVEKVFDGISPDGKPMLRLVEST